MGRGGPVIFLSAGEPSGDLHGARLAAALRETFPGVRLIGLGGPRMAAEGVELLADFDDLSVMGFVEVLGRLPFFIRLRRMVFDRVKSGVDLVIPIDYPGFNLRLAAFAHGRGLPVLYYIAPQVWAWHASRAKDLARDTDRVAVVLPFEADHLTRAGARAEYVGHPLLEVPAPAMSREAWCASEGLDPQQPVLGIFPGSRMQEVSRHLALFSAAADRVRDWVPGCQVVLGASPDIDPSAFDSTAFPRAEQPRELLHFADAALVKSGTTTLEAAIAGTPIVVAYRMSPISFGIARRLVRVPHIALANLVADEGVAPEMVQDAATPDALAAALVPLLSDTSERRAQLAGWARARNRLGTGVASRRVAEIAAELLGGR